MTVPAVFGSVAPTTFAHRGVCYAVTDLFAGGQNDVVFATSPHLPADGAGLTLHVQTISGDLDLALSGATFDSRGYWFFPAAACLQVLCRQRLRCPGGNGDGHGARADARQPATAVLPQHSRAPSSQHDTIEASR